MSRGEGVGNLNAEVEKLIERQRLVGDEVSERDAVEILHGDEAIAFFDIRVVDGADMRMIEGGGGLRFALETFQGQNIVGHVAHKEFQGDHAVQAEVLGLVDDAHATAAQSFEDAVAREGAADEWIGSRHLAVMLGWQGMGSQR